MSLEPTAIDADAILAQLERVLKSEDFNASARNRTFLDYIVHETLEGRSDRIKAYSIATSVLGRGANFDPQLDSIVRIEAGRLRRSLERYYLMSTTNDPIIITIPTGSYVPKFSVDRLPPSDSQVVSRSDVAGRKSVAHHRPGIFVRHFEEDGVQPKYASVPHGLVRQIIAGLARFPDVLVFGPDIGPNSGTEIDGKLDTDRIIVDFYLTGGITVTDDHFGVEVMLVDAKTGRNIWAETFHRQPDPDRCFRARDEVAALIVRALAQTPGVIFRLNAHETNAKSPEEMGAFDYVTLFYEYRQTFDPASLVTLCRGLERAITDNPEYSEAFACLSQVYVDAFRFRHPVGRTDFELLARAGLFARRAVELAPRCSRAFFALSQTLWYSGELKGAFEALETGLALNPNDTDLRAKLGLRYAIRAEWDKAIPLIESSYERNPAEPGYYRLGLALWHFAFGRHREAMAEALKTNTPHLIFGPMMTAIAAKKLGLQQAADAALQDMLSMQADFAEDVDGALVLHNFHPDLIALIVASLIEAGLPSKPHHHRTRRTTFGSGKTTDLRTA